MRRVSTKRRVSTRKEGKHKQGLGAQSRGSIIEEGEHKRGGEHMQGGEYKRGG